MPDLGCGMDKYSAVNWNSCGMDKYSANWFSGKWNGIKYPLCIPKTQGIKATEEIYYSASEYDMELLPLNLVAPQQLNPNQTRWDTERRSRPPPRINWFLQSKEEGWDGDDPFFQPK